MGIGKCPLYNSFVGVYYEHQLSKSSRKKKHTTEDSLYNILEIREKISNAEFNPQKANLVISCRNSMELRQHLKNCKMFKGGINKMKWLLFGVCAVCLIISSCHMFEDNEEMVLVSMEFDKSEMSVWEGGINSVQIKVYPQETLLKYEMVWLIDDWERAHIFEANKRSCTVMGIKEGDTILRAVINGSSATMVVHVLKEN